MPNGKPGGGSMTETSVAMAAEHRASLRKSGSDGGDGKVRPGLCTERVVMGRITGRSVVLALHDGLMGQVGTLQNGARNAHRNHERRQRATQSPPRSPLLPSHDPFSLSAPSGACQTAVLAPAPGTTRANATPAPGSGLR